MNKFFTEYRSQDYRIPRSMREAYGWDAPLHVDKEETSYSGLMVGIGMVGLLIWLAYGWVR